MSDAAFPTIEAEADELVVPNVLDVVLRTGDRADPSADASKRKVLEVVHVFGDAVVDLKHFA
ncbi:MAG: hypothetical protein ACK4YP_10045, partial [Myxococcota bacterium]